jgi:putative tricarboxylic transport membrane protein
MNGDRWVGAFWLASGLCIVVLSSRLALGTIGNPGPGLFPFVAGSILSILSVVLLYRSFKTHDQAAKEPVFANLRGTARAAFVFVALLFYALTMEYLGFVVATFILLASLLWVVGQKAWYVAAPVAALTSLLAYGIFNTGLGADLPVGLFGF